MSSQNRYKPVRLHSDKYVPDNCNYELPPIIFLHGLLAVRSTWDKVRPRIANKTQRQAYSVDLRNHGKSEWSDECCLDALASDLENFLEQEGIKKPVIVGHSLGAKAACTLALRKPWMLSKIVVEDLKTSNGTAEELEQILKVMKSLGKIKNLPSNITEKEAQHFVGRLVKLVYPLQSSTYGDSVYLAFHKGKHGKFSFDFNYEAIEKSFHSVSNYMLNFKECQKFPGPALFIFGAHSLMRVAEDKLTSEFFPNVQFCELKNVDHMPHHEASETFVDEVSKFINNFCSLED